MGRAVFPLQGPCSPGPRRIRPPAKAARSRPPSRLSHHPKAGRASDRNTLCRHAALVLRCTRQWIRPPCPLPLLLLLFLDTADTPRLLLIPFRAADLTLKVCWVSQANAFFPCRTNNTSFGCYFRTPFRQSSYCRPSPYQDRIRHSCLPRSHFQPHHQPVRHFTTRYRPLRTTSRPPARVPRLPRRKAQGSPPPGVLWCGLRCLRKAFRVRLAPRPRRIRRLGRRAPCRQNRKTPQRPLAIDGSEIAQLS